MVRRDSRNKKVMNQTIFDVPGGGYEHVAARCKRHTRDVRL